jgi:hypothetical protein
VHAAATANGTAETRTPAKMPATDRDMRRSAAAKGSRRAATAEMAAAAHGMRCSATTMPSTSASTALSWTGVGSARQGDR